MSAVSLLFVSAELNVGISGFALYGFWFSFFSSNMPQKNQDKKPNSKFKASADAMRTWTVSIYSQDPNTDGAAKPSLPPPIPAPVNVLSSTRALVHRQQHTSTSEYVHAAPVHQPRMSRYTGEALARLWSMLQISLMFSLMQGSLCQQPSIRSYTSFGQVRGRCRTRPCVMHSITCRSTRSDLYSISKLQKIN